MFTREETGLDIMEDVKLTLSFPVLFLNLKLKQSGSPGSQGLADIKGAG